MNVNAPSRVTPVAPAATPVPVAQVAACTELFAALGDPMRQRLIMILAETEELNVSELAQHLPLSRPAISHHLKVLRQAGLVAVRRAGTENNYSLALDDGLALLRRFVDEVDACEG